MKNFDVSDTEVIEKCFRDQVKADALRISVHAHNEMAEEHILYDEICEVLLNGKIIENYPDHQRGPCCLVCGKTVYRRFLHIVCTTSLEVIIIITVYEPKPPKWITPFQRR